jgi:hypothetical protein
MNLVFDDNNTPVVSFMDNEFVGGLECDVVDIASERDHQACSSLDDARPTGKVVEDFIGGIVSDDIKEMLAIDKVIERPSNQIEVRGGGFIGGVFRIWHLELSIRCAGLLTK